ncbi:hypothetical protein [Streptomyces sp. NBC_01216]|uniref:hypothetical protein n=1 Tax=unclassified Streptomyces TaxID=2593676 RepID=UPI002E1069A0|nr:hypothetical protein OG393_09480 [Streptomyces sp. NBC_01216]
MADRSGGGGRYRVGRWGAAVALVPLVALAGCGTDGTSGPSEPGRGTAKNSGEPAPREVLVDLEVSGGFAGVRNRLVVRYDGSYTTRSGTKPPRTGRMEPAEVAELRAALEDPAFAAVPARPSGKTVYDGFEYVITYGSRVVVATDDERPPALRRVFAALPDGGPPTSP